MHKFFLNITLIALAFIPPAAFSETLGKEAIPEKILDQIYKKYPTSLSLSADQEKHFGQDLYAIKFKGKDGESLVKYYRTNGQFFVDGVKVNTSVNANMIPTSTIEILNSTFTKYEISDAIMIVNPNGVGEEYDLIVNSEGVDWAVSVDKTGAITKKVQK